MADYDKALKTTCKIILGVLAVGLLAVGLLGAGFTMMFGELDKWAFWAPDNGVSLTDKFKHFFFVLALLGGGLYVACKAFKKHKGESYTRMAESSAGF